MSWMCQGPHHVGDRVIPHPFDRYVKKVTYRRADAAVRMNERAVTDPNRCRACVELETAEEPMEAMF